MQPFSRNEDEPLHADTGWLSEQGLASLGWAYREAGEVLCDAPGTVGAADEAMYLVASFSFRQSIELYLKAICQLLEAHYNASLPNQLRNKHKLLPLWDWIDGEIQSRSYDALPTDARSVVEDFEKVDPNGTAFRYNLDLQGNAQLSQLPPAVSLGNLRNAASEMIHLLDSLEDTLSEAE
jgi:hypothetical protein